MRRVILKRKNNLHTINPPVMRKFYLLFFTLFISVIVSAQVNFNFITATGNYNSITGTNPTLTGDGVGNPITDEGVADGIPIGFTFNYNGSNYTTVGVSTNGFITLNPVGTNFGSTNDLASGPTPSTSRPIIAPLWDDLDIQAATNLQYSTTGGVFTMEWKMVKWNFNSPAAAISFQVKLYQNTNVIEFIYQQEVGTLTSASASIGITAAATGSGNFMSVENAAGTSTNSTFEYNNISAKPATGQIFRFTPFATCSGTPTAGTAQAPTSRCNNTNFLLRLLGYTQATEITIQWQRSAVGANLWTNIPGATTEVSIVNQTGPSDYRAVVTCSNTAFANSNTITVTEATANCPPLCTNNITPANGAVNVPYQAGINLKWAGSVGATSYELYFGTTTTPVFVGNSADTTIYVTGAASNTLHYWYVVPRSGKGALGTCSSNTTSFTTGSALPPPANDDCANAIVLTASGTALCGTTVSGTTASTTASSGTTAPSCSAAGINDDVWYKFVATATTHKITITNFIYTMAAAVYTGSDCNSLTQVSGACLSGGPNVPGLTIGATYYVRVYTTSSTVTSVSNFDICVIVPLANDDCAGALSISPYTGQVNGTTVNATQSQPAESCAGSTGEANDDVWYKFTTLQAGSATFTMSNVSSALDPVMIGYSGTCGSLTSIGCVDATFSGSGETLTLTGLAANTTYYFRIYGYDGAGTEGTFTITASGTALPVTLTNLRGEKQGNRNILSWTTQSEQNNNGFELQRSADGVNFTNLGFIASKAINGNSSSPISYDFADETPFASNSYYRLRQLDKDGKATVSSVVIIKGLKPVKLEITIYPNPAKSVLNVLLSTPVNNNINLMITDLEGKTLINKPAKLVTGDNNILVNISGLASGTYIIKTVCSNGCETGISKFVKQ